MPPADERNTLRIGPLGFGHAATAAMAQAVRTRIAAAGGALTIWAVLHEDIYETTFGDGCYLHVRGIALNHTDAERLAGLPAYEQFSRWHVKPYSLGLKGNMPILLDSWPLSEEFTIGDVVEILAEIPPGGTVSRLLTGPGHHGRRPGPHMLSLPQGSR